MQLSLFVSFGLLILPALAAPIINEDAVGARFDAETNGNTLEARMPPTNIPKIARPIYAAVKGGYANVGSNQGDKGQGGNGGQGNGGQGNGGQGGNGQPVNKAHDDEVLDEISGGPE